MENSIKREALAMWAKLVAYFGFLPAPEARGAAVIASAVLLLIIAPLLFFLLLSGLTGLVLYRASKDA